LPLSKLKKKKIILKLVLSLKWIHLDLF